MEFSCGYYKLYIFVYSIGFIYSLLGYHHSCAGSRNDRRCSFPEEWRGMWYQNGLGSVNLTQHTITKKGTCFMNQDNRYVVYDSNFGCYRCLVITPQHTNVLQYKESFCLGDSEKPVPHDLCDRILRDYNVLYTLIREPSKPVPCPFHGSFFFSYQNNSVPCITPFSSVDECASNTRFMFHFKQCKNTEYSQNLDLDFHCLATWKSGQNYMIGHFQGRGLRNNKNLQYRCFMYEAITNKVMMAMSADASCMGLVEPRDGPLTMNLERDVQKFATIVYQFPEWFWRRDTKWHDLSGKYTYHLDKDKQVIRISYQAKSGDEKEVIEAIRCYEIDRVTTTERLFQAVSITSKGCETKFQCIRILQRNDDIAEFHRGKMVDQQSKACLEDNFNFGVKQLLIPSRIRGSKCPYDGRYSIDVVKGSPTCTSRSTFISGCVKSQQLRVEITCPSISAANLVCLSKWSQNTTTYMIARQAGGGKLANCFSFRQLADEQIQFSLDTACNMGAPLLLNQQVHYTLRKDPGNCDTKVIIKGGSISDKSTPKEVRKTAGMTQAASRLHVSIVTLCLPLLLLITSKLS
ncbi:uncharacterized protein LOC135486573 isoform X2 [Lineus longissimus]|uniref:uncharacterized protein LOC135486573 isoform X2 n=1 Tax=Lineus longissimus TaxID=88925 RepID=UPI002B4D0B7F